MKLVMMKKLAENLVHRKKERKCGRNANLESLSRRRLVLENLEERALLAVTLGADMGGAVLVSSAVPAPLSEAESATFVVTTLSDVVDETDEVLSLREALAAASDGDVITFDLSLSWGTIALSGTELTIDKGVTIDASNLFDGITIDAQGNSRVFCIASTSEEPAAVTLRSLRIIGGNSASDSAVLGAGNGGGIYCQSSYNWETQTFYTACSITLEDCVLSGNSADGKGGALFFNDEEDCSLTFTNTSFYENTASYGGALYLFSYKNVLTMTGGEISGNTAQNDGGGIYCESCGMNLTDVVVYNNEAISGNGGGICGYQNYGKTLTFSECLIDFNRASGNGGGISLDDGSYTNLNVTQCTLIYNSAASGGGVYGGCYDDSETFVYVTLNNTIAAKNTGGDLAKSNDGVSLAGHNNLSSFTAWEESLSGENALYDETLPLFKNEDDGDFSLAADSQAINLGSNVYVTQETDLAKNPRISGGIVDIGAYEYQLPETLIVTTLADSVDETDGVLSLREALAQAKSGDTVAFDASLSGGRITLSGTVLAVNKSLTIDASALADGIIVDANKLSRVFFVAVAGEEEASVTFKNLTITGGYTVYNEDDWTSNEGSGGGIYCQSNYNWETDVYYSACSIILENCVITENEAAGNGGGIYFVDDEGSSLTLTNCVLSKNTANYGGGLNLFSYRKALLMTNCQISENTAKYSGGGIYLSEGGGSLVDCILTHNAVTSGNGGGFYGYENNSKTLTMTGCLVAENTASGSGGGICLSDEMETNLILTSVTIAGNTAENGGGIYAQGYTDYGAAVQITLYNTIAAVNNGGDLVCESDEGYTVAGCNNLSTFTKWDPDASDANLLYKAQKPLFTDAANGDWTLCEGSQAIDVGENSYVTQETDLAGKARIVNQIVDLGAYEYQGKEFFASLSTDTPSIGTLLTVSLTPSDARANYAWFRVASDGTETLIDGAVTARYKVTLADLGYVIKVVATGKYAYAGGTASAATSVSIPLQTPKIAKITPNGQEAKVVWGSVFGASSYTLIYSQDAEFGTFETLETAAASVTVEGLTLGADYYFKVKAVSETFRESAFSDAKSVSLTKLATPSITSFKASGSSILIAWNPVAGASRYVLQTSTDNFAHYDSVIIDDPAAASWTLSGLTMGEVYSVRLQARAASGSGLVNSEYAVRRVTLNKLAAPVVTSLTAVEKGVEVAWTPVEGANRYVISYSLDSEFTEVRKKVVNNASSAVISGLEAGETYYFKVQARDSSGTYKTSEDSEVQSLLIPEALPASDVWTEWNEWDEWEEILG